MAGKYYSPSGNFTPIGLAIALAAGVLSAALLSWIYGYGMWYIPVVQISVLGVIFYGLAIGFAVGFGVKKGKIRNRLVALGLGAAVSAFAIYAGWVAWIFAFTEQEALVISPAGILGGIAKLGETGVWTVFDSTPTGWALYGFWIVEAAIIAGIIIFMAYNAVDDLAFCEKCDCWMNDPVVLAVFATDPNIGEIKRALELERLDSVQQLVPLQEIGAEFTTASVESCGQCGTNHLLSITEKTVTIDGEGNEQIKDNHVMRRLYGSTAMLDAIVAHGESVFPDEDEDFDDEEESE